MAFFALWVLGFLICILAVLFLYKQVASLKKSMDFQKQFMKVHPDAVRASFDQGWMWLDILLAFFVLSFASQSKLFAEGEGFQPEILSFVGIAVFCASKAVAHWNDGRLLFYRQGLVYHDQDIPFSSIRSLTLAGSQYELATKKEKLLLSKKEGQTIEEKMKEWKKNKRAR